MMTNDDYLSRDFDFETDMQAAYQEFEQVMREYDADWESLYAMEPPATEGEE